MEETLKKNDYKIRFPSNKRVRSKEEKRTAGEISDKKDDEDDDDHDDDDDEWRGRRRQKVTGK